MVNNMPALMRKMMRKMVYPVLGLALSGCVGMQHKYADPINELKQPAIARIYSTNEVANGGTVSNNLGRLSYNGFDVGYERYDDGDGQAFGAKTPVGQLLKSKRTADLYFLRFEDSENAQEQNELIVRVKPLSYEFDIVARGIDFADKDGFALAVNCRQQADFDAKDNIGGGAAFAKLGDSEDIGAYVWGRFEGLKGMFAGAGTYLNDKRFVIGMPNKEGPSWRYLRIDRDNGSQLNEFLFSTEGVNLNGIDFWATVHTNEFDHTVAFTRGSVFRYVVPPISARGRGWTGGIIHTETPEGKDTLSTDVVRYVGQIFIGGRYVADFGKFGDGKIGIPVGYQFNGGDGLTRNFIRAVPTYNQEIDSWELGVIGELKF